MEPHEDGILFSRGYQAVEGAPLVLVHPRFQGTGWCDLFDEATREYRQGNYGKNVTDLITKHRGVIITFEDVRSVALTDGWLRELSDADKYYVCTQGETTSEPIKEIGWDAAVGFVKGFGSRVYMAGGNVSYYRGKLNGCLGSVYEKLKEAGVQPELVPGCCFTHDRILE